MAGGADGIFLQGDAGKGKEDKGKAFFVKRVRFPSNKTCHEPSS